MPPRPPSPLIVALDVPTPAAALRLAAQVRPHVGFVKVGLEGFVGAGPTLVAQLQATGCPVFLDLKLHDIPRTAAAAATQVARLGVGMLTVHAAGGVAMLAAVREALPASTLLLAVTVLTSLDGPACAQVGWPQDVATTSRRLAELALQHGADGVVCAASDLRHLADLPGLRVVPGIRPSTAAAADDQRRVATPATALSMGADYLVVGRPIHAAADPAAAAAALAAECRAELQT